MNKRYIITSDKFLEAKKLITKNGGTIYTDGSFEISGVEGNFTYDNGTLEIRITDKPWLASWGMIEDKLDEFFN
jgi:hypothetical protein